jgi:hypothetical protein
MGIVERYPVVSAGLAELASRDRQGIEARTPVDLDTHALHLGTDHARVEPKVVAHADCSVNAGRDMSGDVGE